MHRRLAVWLLFIGFMPSASFAHCGAENCPLDSGGRWAHSAFTFNASFQYIDQDQSRYGTQDVEPGSVPADEEEIRTINRTTTFSASYQGVSSWYISASLPYVNRYHEHIDTTQPVPETMRWTYGGLGDLELGVSRSFGGGEKGSRQFVSVGVKAPTGDTSVPEVNGEQPEPSARPGTGSWDFLAGVGSQWRVDALGSQKRGDWLTLRLSATGRINGTGTDDYKIGDQVQLHAGADYPVSKSVGLLAQVNYRYRGKDSTGSTNVTEEDTGGSGVYLSPGLRVATSRATSIYGLVQIPLYQNVNGIQIVPNTGFYFGVTNAIF
jgi:hypothetical protein